jgi:uncharacterized protein YbbC (DUF1343 family)
MLLWAIAQAIGLPVPALRTTDTAAHYAPGPAEPRPPAAESAQQPGQQPAGAAQVPAARPAGPAMPVPVVQTGLEVLLSSRRELLAGKRVGILTNPSAVDSNLVGTAERLQKEGFTVAYLFAPEHGIHAATANGTTSKVPIDPVTGAPIEGLWGRDYDPSDEAMAAVDVIVFDIQDIGSRTYTYITSLGKIMQACKKAGKPIVVLDRPNPLGGTLFEGPIRLAKYKSLIGWGPFPVTHGMTVGEIAQFYNKELKIDADLTVVPMTGWRRSMMWEDTGLLWVPTSPGIPKPLNAYLYVATGMVCGSGPNCNEGGGNSMPFELIGAPWMDAAKLAQTLETLSAGVDGVQNIKFRPIVWLPYRGQYANKPTSGVQLHMLKREGWRPLRTALVILTGLHQAFGSKLEVKDTKRFGRVWGNDDVLQRIQAGQSWQEIEASWQPELQRFGQVRTRYLMYP